ncbi:MAG: DNA polymerase III subunit alpha [Actinomycetota bacterium]|nr:DNA polymerase III subunit alpha [Actinomycetota bacterium]
MSFVHLHCHSTWSLLDGAIPAEALAHAAAALGMEAVAMTDHDALTGAVRFSKACRDAGVKPIYGAELTVAKDQHVTRGVWGGSSSRRTSPRRTGGATEHVTVIARDRTGYANLCRLISKAHLSNERNHPSTTFEAIAERSEGLFVLSGCGRSEVARLAAAGAIPDAIEAARKWRDAIGDGYRIEVFDHRGYGHRTLRNRLLRVAQETGIPTVATNNVHYALPEHAGTHEVLHAVKDIVPLSKTHALRQTSEYYLKDPREMRALFDDAPQVLDESLRIADACEFDLDLGSYHFPDLPPAIGRRSGETATGLLARRCYEGARRRYGSVSNEVDERLQRELGYIFRGAPSATAKDGGMHGGYASYFLLVADIVDHVKRVLGIRCACRGSAAGSLVCYVLGISDVDPVRYDLLFERFMNSRREELPDIDIDVESHRREEVLAYVLDTFGPDQTAVCCMVDTFKARMAIRDVGKALGLPPSEVDLIAKAFPRVRASDIPAAIERLPELIGSNLRSGQLEQLFELCGEVDGFPRHLALHPSGVILSSPDLADRVPMQESFQGFTMLQADKDDVEELGLVKLDVLGVRMLSSIAHARDEIKRVHGKDLDVDSLRPDDRPTFDLISSSRTLGCFQIESPGQRELLARLQPRCFEDLIVDISLFRPGPVKSDMVSPFLDRRHGFKDVSYAHPALEPILKETNGVVVYHEQVMRVIAAVTGCSLDDADYVRRHLDAQNTKLTEEPQDAFGRSHRSVGPENDRKLPEAIEWGAQVVERFGREKSNSNGKGGVVTFDQKLPEAYATPKLGEDWVRSPRVHQHGVAGKIEIVPPEEDVARWFVTSAISNGFEPKQATALWREVFSFASFGFCKSHAAAFALPTYVSAYLKTHYPAEFLAGVLTHDPGMYPRRSIVSDARLMGVPILPIDVNRSDELYRAERVGDRMGIRLSLSQVREISSAEVESIVTARDQGGAYKSLEDLWRRAEISRPVLENLVHIGALDSIEPRSRREVLWRAIDLCAETKPVPKRRATPARRSGRATPSQGQMSLTLDEPISESLAELPDYSAMEETEAELEVSGIDARRHLMELYRPLFAELGCTPAGELRSARNRSDVWVAGVKVSTQTPAIRSGQRIIFLTVEDPSGPVEVTVFERAQPRCARTLFHSWLLLVRGEVRKRGGASLVQEMHPDNVGVTVVAEEAFDLAEIARAVESGDSIEAALKRQRERQRAAGLQQPEEEAPTRLWHASGGSAGR